MHHKDRHMYCYSNTFARMAKLSKSLRVEGNQWKWSYSYQSNFHHMKVSSVLHQASTRAVCDGILLLMDKFFASDPKTNKIIEVWKLSNYPQLPRGWTRGLCILHDGILVGSTCIRQTADVWMKRHGNEWNFDIKSSKTSVSFIPFKRSSGTSETCNVNILNERSAKIFSLLVTPDV